MKFSVWIVFVVAVVMTSCESGKKVTTNSGIEVEFARIGEGEAILDSTILRLDMTYKNANGYELFNSAERGGPMPLQYNKVVWKTTGLLYEALELMKVGDSIQFDIPAKDLYTNTFKMPVPDSLDENSMISFSCGLVSMMTVAEWQKFQADEIASSQKGLMVKDGESIDQYLSENGIEAITTDTGLRYVITQVGSGSQPVAGQRVTVHYHGTLMDGTKFDSSYDRGDPFEFVLGQGRVIKGWDEGIALLNKGAKATLYIPSSLAYGQRGSGKIKANAVLKFDVELVDFAE